MLRKAERVFAAYNLKVLQSVLQVETLMEQNGLELKDLEEYIKASYNSMKRQRPIIFACPDCGAPLRFMEVNNNPARIVGKDYKTMCTCVNWKSCAYEKYFKEDIDKVLASYSEKSTRKKSKLLGGKNGIR